MISNNKGDPNLTPNSSGIPSCIRYCKVSNFTRNLARALAQKGPYPFVLFATAAARFTTIVILRTRAHARESTFAALLLK